MQQPGLDGMSDWNNSKRAAPREERHHRDFAPLVSAVELMISSAVQRGEYGVYVAQNGKFAVAVTRALARELGISPKFHSSDAFDLTMQIAKALRDAASGDQKMGRPSKPKEMLELLRAHGLMARALGGRAFMMIRERASYEVICGQNATKQFKVSRFSDPDLWKLVNGVTRHCDTVSSPKPPWLPSSRHPDAVSAS